MVVNVMHIKGHRLNQSSGKLPVKQRDENNRGDLHPTARLNVLQDL